MLDIIVAIKIWEVLSSGKARDSTLAAYARNSWLLLPLYNVQITVQHIFGSKNNVADILSR